MKNKQSGKYYTVLVNADNATQKKIPYLVFAASDYQAARIIRDEIGYMAHQRDIEGPYYRL